MTSASQRRANRKNATHSTGPTSESGKSTSALNSLKHGLASSQLLIPGESEIEFNTLLTALLTEHQPTTFTETLLVQDMAKHHWLTSRALRLQSEALSTLDPPLPTLALLLRYQTANERAFHRALTALLALRKAAKTEIGSASKSAARTLKQAESAMDAAQKQRYNEWLANMLRDCQPPPTYEKLIADGFVLNTATGNWEKTVDA